MTRAHCIEGWEHTCHSMLPLDYVPCVMFPWSVSVRPDATVKEQQ